MPVEVGANQSERFTAYARPGSRQPEFTIRLLDQNGRRVGGASQDTVMPQAPESIMPDETLILTLGRPQGVETIADLPGFKVAARGPSRSAGVEIVTARIDPQAGSMPGRWYGYDAARAVVVDTADRETMAALDALRGQPLVDWVARGGHLVVSVGANWQAVRDSVLGPILPGLPSGQEKVASLEALDTFAGSNKPITPPGHAAGDGHQARGARRARREGPERDVEHAAGRAGRARFRPGDPDRARRRPEAVFRLGRPVACSGSGPST